VLVVLLMLGKVKASDIVVSNGVLFVSDYMEMHQFFVRGGRYKGCDLDSDLLRAGRSGGSNPRGVRLSVSSSTFLRPTKLSLQ
jgi:hypothetical protein